jgi:hypothetical protein
MAVALGVCAASFVGCAPPPAAPPPVLEPQSTLWQPAEETRLMAPPEVSRPRMPARTELRSTVPHHLDAPVFYEDTWQAYGFPDNLVLAHQGKLFVGVMGIIDLDTFSWQDEEMSNSYWVALENYRYLLPLIASDRAEDQAFVRDWIDKWLQNHRGDRPLNYGDGDAMSVAQRTLAFVWYLRKRSLAGHPEDDLTQRMRDEIHRDQAYLRDHYQPVSNHGFWEAMGLLETTRVYPDSILSNLALDRFQHIARLSFSAQGLHMEHSPAYHFFTVTWVRQFADYVENMGLQWSGMQELLTLRERLRTAGYYLVDHSNQLAQIGDSDYTRLDASEVLPDGRVPKDQMVFDPEAGYAAYKDDVRLILFAIQNQKNSRLLRFHYHDDALAVYFAPRGEVVLGDSGRYAYGRGKIRGFFQSKDAHNTFYPRSMLQHGMRYVVNPRAYRDDLRSTFMGTLQGAGATRTVSIAHDAQRVEVLDEFKGAGEWFVHWNIGHDVESLAAFPTQLSADSTSTVYSWQMKTRGQHPYVLRILLPVECDHVIVVEKGEEKPLLGWYSPMQEVMLPTPVIRLIVRNRGPVRVMTVVDDLEP